MRMRRTKARLGARWQDNFGCFVLTGSIFRSLKCTKAQDPGYHKGCTCVDRGKCSAIGNGALAVKYSEIGGRSQLPIGNSRIVTCALRQSVAMKSE